MNRKQAEKYLDDHQVEAKIEAQLADGATVYSIMVDPQHLPTKGPSESNDWAVLIHGTSRQTNIANLMQAAPLVPLGCVMFLGNPLRSMLSRPMDSKPTTTFVASCMKPGVLR
jgi:hypothetical protein